MPPEGEAQAPGALEGGMDPLAGYSYRPGRRGPRSTLKPEMIKVIAESVARFGVKRIAAATAGTTEDCLSAWLARGQEALKRKKRSLYTELFIACEEAWAHRYGFLIELGEKTVTERHFNPRFITWVMAVTAPKQFSIQKEGQRQVGGQLGPAFEMVTPQDAARGLEEKLQHFLETEAHVEKILAESAAPPPAGGG